MSEYTQDPIPGLESLPEPLPQPECASCHSFGPVLVQDAIQRLKNSIESDKLNGWVSAMVDASDLSVVLTALERHHQHS
jgi:hypothetical protein